ncbi:MAG: hypothetical protein D6814_14355, partial [Calditrichaeota bacterium]
MRCRIKIFSLLVIFSVSSILHAQRSKPPPLPAQQIRFKHLTIDDGLSQNLVYSIFQDSKGFLWFGTSDGLNRYDGYRFKVFKHNPFDSTSLADNDIVYSIFEDRAGRIWVGTRALHIFDRKTETFRRFVHDPDNPASLSSGQVRAIAEDRDGSLWIAIDGGGLCRLTLVPVSEPGKNGASDENTNAIRVPNGDGYEWVTVKITRFVHEPENPNSLSTNTVHNVIVDHQNRLWVTARNQLNMLDLELV